MTGETINLQCQPTPFLWSNQTKRPVVIATDDNVIITTDDATEIAKD